MKERLFRLSFADIRISVILFESTFCMQSRNDVQWSMAYLTQLHQHSSFEIFFVPGGELGIVTEEEAVTSRDSVIIVPPFVNHYTVPRGSQVYCFCFTLERAAKGEGRLFDCVSENLSGGISFLEMSEDERFYISHLAEAIKGVRYTEDTEHFLSLLFSELFSRLAPHVGSERETAGKYGNYTNTIDTYVAAHYTENVRLEDLAEELYLCTKQVSRIIRREYGCSLSELVNRRRLAVACMLLKYTSMSIGEISSTVGYGHENYFFTMFRREYGITPKRYREESIKEDTDK
ncbi:MAG: helix-turn-helix transcriptional regulator [Clostridia bacterium]|nr:helix-turn-helix transcriptional regulator [Clostridia bacterium]